MVKREHLIHVDMYPIHHLSPSYADNDDTTLIDKLETSVVAYIYTSRPACPFGLDDVFRINTGVLRCMMMYRTISEPRIIYIYLYFSNTGTLIVRREYIRTFEMYPLKLSLLLFISMYRWLIIIIVVKAVWRH